MSALRRLVDEADVVVLRTRPDVETEDQEGVSAVLPVAPVGSSENRPMTPAEAVEGPRTPSSGERHILFWAPTFEEAAAGVLDWHAERSKT